MDIKMKYRVKGKLEDKIDQISDEVRNRWRKLTSTTSFEDWSLSSDEKYVEIYYYWRSDKESFSIPVRFFEIENDDEAVEEFQKFQKQEAAEQIIKTSAEKRESEWEEYKRLKKEFEPNG